uniref:Protein arginine N-methyltransferase 5 n=1 Tax=Catharus ustulatus TaxID=91951 RepID=A0A8C3V0I7_CATUS
CPCSTPGTGASSRLGQSNPPVPPITPVCRFDFLCLPLFHPRHRREFQAGPARERPGPQTRSDLVLAGRDWNTLIVGKLSPWIRPDSPLEHVRKNSQKALRQELDFGAYLGLAAHLVPLRGSHNPNLARGLTLELGPDLPSAPALARWLGEPVRAALLPTRLFLTNKKGFPVLGRGHQRLLGQLLKLDVQIILQGSPQHGGRPLSAYLQYLEHLGQHRPPPSAYELYARGYEDYLQSPLQPLMDNLESQTYEVFEKDPIKYCQYQQAIFRCLQDRVPEEERETKVQVIMVLGAGRGPLVAAALRAARQAGARVRLYAVEKNPNAVVTLENCQWEEWGSQVSVVSRDMRGWEAPEPADLVVSELLGSFGDNELSPECLDGARGCLKEDGVSIPQSYTSFLAPVSSSKLYNEVRGCREHDRHPEIPAPTTGANAELTWRVQVGTVLHGFAGYFETTLYDDVTLSIRPETHSPGLFSWFPIFFPIKVREIGAKKANFGQIGIGVGGRSGRVATPTKVWYEWAVTSPACSALHNPSGRSYTIGL